MAPQVDFVVEYQLAGECTFDPNAFITTWDTRLGLGLFSNAPDVTLALTGTVNATIDWGDGTITTVTTPGERSHDYVTPGIYTISITGSATAFYTLPDWEFNETTLVSVDNWGQMGFQSLSHAFSHASYLISVPNNTVGLEGVTNMSGMFFWASSFNQDIGDWDVSNVTNMNEMFYTAYSFNQDFSGWCVSNISTQPDFFDNGATSWVLPRPVWDTCP